MTELLAYPSAPWTETGAGLYVVPVCLSFGISHLRPFIAHDKKLGHTAWMSAPL